MKKYLVLFGLLVLVPACANADVSVKDTTSPEFIYNQGYSKEVSRIIEVKTKDPATPIPVEEKNAKWKSLGWEMLETLDPTVDRKGNFVDHDIKYQSTWDDL